MIKAIVITLAVFVASFTGASVAWLAQWIFVLSVQPPPATSEAIAKNAHPIKVEPCIEPKHQGAKNKHQCGDRTHE